MGYQRIAPGQSVADHAETLLARIAGELTDKGHRLADTEVHMNVTTRADDEVALIQERAAQIGFGALVFVDDHQPSRPGTVPSSTLSPLASSVAAEARAARILGDRFD